MTVEAGPSCPRCGHRLVREGDLCSNCSSSDTHAPFPAIEGYRLIRTIGEGGMGTVFLAVEETLVRRVAVKVMLASLQGDESAHGRFLREARSMATVEHPNVVRVYAFGRVKELTYIVMEYVEGESAAERIRRTGPLPVREALTILRPTVEALAAAWDKEIVHRDVKPSNILLGPQGRVALGARLSRGRARPRSRPRPRRSRARRPA